MTRDELIERYRDTNVEHTDWWEDTYDFFASEMRDNYGVAVRNIQFSGFWSQGDGASFETEWTQIPALLTRLGLAEKYPEWTFYEEAPEIRVVRSGYHYSHSNMMCAQICENQPMHFQGSDDAVGAAVWEKYVELRDESAGRLKKELLDFFRGQADELYKRLQDEYEYLTSDEAVWESIEANGLDKDEDEENEDETE